MADLQMLDTSVCVALLRAASKRLTPTQSRRPIAGACISSIVLAELQAGAHKSHRPAFHHALIEAFTAGVPVRPFDTAAARAYGEIRADLEARGTPIGPLDILIAAHARSLGAILHTDNATEFKRVQGLKCQAWS
ncbi:MAG: type II toxin-antitoxin system VapC family toxin [Verrucomicrobiae bacterium]|nr:type II toxin-antitoxin system VapC family toxin [Verrucomicrobiae bacterium]